MLKPLQYRIVCAIGAMSIALFSLDNGLYFFNQALQSQASARAQYIQQANAIGTLYQQTAKTLANLALERRDDEIKAMLIKEGFTFNPAPANPASAGDGSKR